MTIPLLAHRRPKRRRFKCSECNGLLLRKYRGARIHRKCWIDLEAGVR